MSLFFEDEIQKAMRMANDLDLDKIMAQDPRRSNRFRNNTPTPQRSDVSQFESTQRPTRRRNRWN